MLLRGSAEAARDVSMSECPLTTGIYRNPLIKGAVRWRFLSQTRVSQGIPQREPFLPILFAEEIAVR